MTDETRQALLEMIDRFTEEDTRSPEIARAALIKEGIYTEQGDLAPQFSSRQRED